MYLAQDLLQEARLPGHPARSGEAERAQCSAPGAPSLPCLGFSRGEICAPALSAADSGLACISLEERQTQLTSPGTNKLKASDLEQQVPVCWGTRPWSYAQLRLSGEGGMFQPSGAASASPCPVARSSAGVA